MQKIRQRKKKTNFKFANIKEIFKEVISNITHSWKLYSGFVLVAVIFLILLAGMTAQQESYTNLRAQIKRLQDQKIELDNVKKKIMLEKIELENQDRIKEIAKTKMGLVEDLNKKVVVIKVKQ